MPEPARPRTPFVVYALRFAGILFFIGGIGTIFEMFEALQALAVVIGVLTMAAGTLFFAAVRIVRDIASRS